MRLPFFKSGPSSQHTTWSSALAVAGIFVWTCRGVNGCWQRVDNPVIWSDAGLAEALCGSCAWSCIGDTCAAPDCNDGDYDGDGQPDCRCDLCGEEVSETVFNSLTCRCESQIIDADGNIVSAEGVEEPVCVGIEVDTNYVGGDCACYEESPFISYDGTHLRPLGDADACVRACADFNMPKYVYRESSQQCWCKVAEAADDAVQVIGNIAGDVSTYLANCAEPLPVPMSGEIKAAIGVSCLFVVVLALGIWWVVRSNKTGTFCCC